MGEPPDAESLEMVLYIFVSCVIVTNVSDNISSRSNRTHENFISLLWPLLTHHYQSLSSMDRKVGASIYGQAFSTLSAP